MQKAVLRNRFLSVDRQIVYSVMTQRIRIRVDAPFAYLPRRLYRAVQQQLVCCQREFCQRPDGSLQAMERGRRFVDREGDEISFPAGSIERVVSALQAQGYAVEVCHAAPTLDSSATCESSLQSCLSVLPHVASAVREHFSALIEIRVDRDRPEAIGHICRIFPRARILVPVLRRSDMARLVVDLQRFVGGNVAGVSRGDWRSGCRVVCCSYRAWETSDCGDWDMVLTYDGAECLQQKGQQCLIDYVRRRRFGLIRDFDKLDSRARLVLELGFGSLVRRPSSSHRHTEVVFACPPILLTRSRSIVERKQQISADQRRNEFIASLANGFAQRLHAPLWDGGLFLNEAQPFNRWKIGPSIAVLVEKERHAAMLADMLPAWRLEGRTPGIHRRFRNELGWIERVILTVAAAHRRGPLLHDVVLNAVGGERPVIRLRERSAGRDAATGALVVDLADDFDQIARRQTQARLNQYFQFGWVIGALPEWMRQQESESGFEQRQDGPREVRLQRPPRTPRAGATPAV